MICFLGEIFWWRSKEHRQISNLRHSLRLSSHKVYLYIYIVYILYIYVYIPILTITGHITYPQKKPQNVSSFFEQEKLAILQWWCPSWHVISLLSCAFFGMAYNVVPVQGMQDYVGMPCGRYEHYIEPGWEVTLDQRSREEVDEGNPSDGFPPNSFEAIGGLWKQIVERNSGKFHDTCLFMLFGVACWYNL